jgi:ubiquinone/menaquinone biosynthesis C-methylase UbiE
MENSMSEPTKELTPDRIYYFPRLDIVLEDFETSGLILDIGGGGEGVIGRMKGSRVVAVDNSREELEAAPPGPLKIVMDACQMLFLDCSFSTATSFMTLLYLNSNDHPLLFEEVYRVLTPGGQFLVWEVVIPPQIDPQKDIAAFPVRVHLSDSEEVTAGYGTHWPDHEHNLEYFSGLAERAGFRIVSRKEKERLIFLELQRPLGERILSLGDEI